MAFWKPFYLMIASRSDGVRLTVIFASESGRLEPPPPLDDDGCLCEMDCMTPGVASLFFASS